MLGLRGGNRQIASNAAVLGTSPENTKVCGRSGVDRQYFFDICCAAQGTHTASPAELSCTTSTSTSQSQTSGFQSFLPPPMSTNSPEASASSDDRARALESWIELKCQQFKDSAFKMSSGGAKGDLQNHINESLATLKAELQRTLLTGSEWKGTATSGDMRDFLVRCIDE
eukprot:6485471-Amphidinium_carterae.1